MLLNNSLVIGKAFGHAADPKGGIGTATKGNRKGHGEVAGATCNFPGKLEIPLKQLNEQVL